MAKWLDKYDAPKAQNGIEGTMGGLTDKGFNYNGAWGGPSMQMGGNIQPPMAGAVQTLPMYQMGGYVYPTTFVPQAQKGLTFLQPTSSKLPEGYKVPYGIPSTELATSIGGEDGEPAFLVPSFKYGQPLRDPIDEFNRTGEHLGGPFKNIENAERFGEMRHRYVERGQNVPSPYKWWDELKNGGSVPGSVGFTYARTQGIPSEGPYGKKTVPSAQNGQEMQFYQNGLDWTPRNISKNGSVVKDDMGYWNPDNWGKVVEIDSPNITMKGVNQDLIGVSDTGDVQYMTPGKDYKFKGKKVKEYPVGKYGVNQQDEKTVQHLDQLLNFTNKPKAKNGWLSKYE